MKGAVVPFQLNDRVSMVTGANRGIGRATALVLAAAGSDVVLIGRDDAALHVVGREVQALGRAVAIIVVDVTERDAAARAVHTAIQRFARLDILVNNAGVNNVGQIESIDDETWEAAIAVNLTAAYRFCREAFGPMRTRGWGRLINIASITAQTGGVSGSVAYSAAKGGMLAMTRTLARDGAPHRITANAIAPGQIDTGMSRAMDPEALRRVEASIPLGRLGTAEEIAYAALYLASEEAGYITGATLDVNGGLLKR
jgi:3-oxoacyl-[acyl-carrier protein] reductase